MEGRLRIERDGLVSPDTEARSTLGARAGSYVLLPTPSDLLVAISGGGDARPPPARRLILVGDLSGLPFPDLVSLLMNAGLSGVLRVQTESGERTIVFSGGEVRGASSSRPGERFSEVAARMGVLDAQRLEVLLARAPERRPGRVAVESGLLSESELWRVMQEHVVRIFQAVVVEDAGTFSLTEEPIEDSATIPGLSAQTLLMEALRRIDERSAPAGEEGLTRILGGYNRAFRDIFTTAERAGAADEVRRAASWAFAGDAKSGAFLSGIDFDEGGEIAEETVLARCNKAAALTGDEPADLLRGALAEALLFLLFVAGEHLDGAVHAALHQRVKELVRSRA